MNVTFTVEGVPPKKDGANSMWRKPSEIARLKNLRLAASRACAGEKTCSPISLTVRVFAAVSAGDLDNFVTGVCDGLMAAHPNTPIIQTDWSDVPPAIHPANAIVYDDDSCVFRIIAERLECPPEGPRYEIELAW
jgi:hypothetical protein